MVYPDHWIRRMEVYRLFIDNTITTPDTSGFFRAAPSERIGLLGSIYYRKRLSCWSTCCMYFCLHHAAAACAFSNSLLDMRRGHFGHLPT
ncbi:hypothetical protein HNY73_005271 [Argiope bruennichi]|uniref:Uncharacterized protein n=1 Tax=Argiope bruennichi TaxID=94029 RepID=A0A8T0FN58_ARGBR|nr:hypothetical protein HNY73_005271 [Argiope bruennichi]